MLEKNKEKYNKIYNKFIKRIISGAISLVIPLTAAGCAKNNNDNYSDKDSISYSESSDIEEESYSNINQEYLNDNNFFANRKGYYESNDEDLKNILNDIKQVNYYSNDTFFNNYDVYSMPLKEMNHILSNYKFDNIDNKKISENYDWYSNGVINKQVLYNKIVSNTEKLGVKIDDNLSKFITCIVNMLPETLNSIDKMSNNFDYSIAFHNIDNLTVNTTEDNSIVAYYTYFNNQIFINYSNIDSYEFLEETISHEISHLVMNKSFSEYDFLKYGCSIDDESTKEAPLDLRFLEEYIAEEVSNKTLNKSEANYFAQEEEKINLLSCSTNYDKNSIISNYASGNQNNLINMFEEEFQDFNYVYSTLNSLNISCGYEDLNLGDSEYSIRGEFNNYAKVQLVKNAYARVTKNYFKGNIDKSEFENQINNIKNTFVNTDYKYRQNDDYLYDIFNQLDDICLNYEKTKSR